MASVTYGECIMANVIMAKVFMAKVLWHMKLSPSQEVIVVEQKIQSKKTRHLSYHQLYIINFRSVEGRGIFGLKIGSSPLGTETRAVWIDGGIHARSVSKE